MTIQDPIRRRKLSDDVEERLLSLIQDGGLAPGDPMPSERELMERFAVGRPAIREAMQNLERMCLVEIRHGERARVAEPSFARMVDQMGATMRHLLTFSPASVEHLKEARAVFEADMARIAAKRRSSSDIKRLRGIVDEQEALSGDLKRFVAHDGLFHREIAVITGNPIFVSLSESMFGWLSQFHANLVRKKGRERETIIEHHEVIDAIADGAAEKAARSIEAHLNRSRNHRHRSEK
ncbi:MAG: transcriptional regulator NanR [Rhodospirillales bacterium]|nr:transcriptional regulator NanR [Rhodospirillales bacterium]